LRRQQALHAAGVDLSALERARQLAEDDRGEVRQQRLGYSGLHAEERGQGVDQHRGAGIAEQRTKQAAAHVGGLAGVRATEQAGEVAEHAHVEAAEGRGDLPRAVVRRCQLGEATEQCRDGGRRRRLGLPAVGADQRAEAAENGFVGQLACDHLHQIHVQLQKRKKKRRPPVKR